MCGFPLSAEWACQTKKREATQGRAPSRDHFFQRHWISEVRFALFLLQAHPLQDQQGEFVRGKRAESDETCVAFRAVWRHRPAPVILSDIIHTDIGNKPRTDDAGLIVP